MTGRARQDTGSPTTTAARPTALSIGSVHERGAAESAEDAKEFEQACRQLISRGQRVHTVTFGTVGVEDQVRFMEIHTRHHAQ